MVSDLDNDTISFGAKNTKIQIVLNNSILVSMWVPNEIANEEDIEIEVLKAVKTVLDKEISDRIDNGTN